MPPRKRATLNSVSRLGLREHGAETRQKTSYAAPTSSFIQQNAIERIKPSNKMPKDPQQQQAKRSILMSSAPAETEPEPQYHLNSTQRPHSTQDTATID